MRDASSPEAPACSRYSLTASLASSKRFSVVPCSESGFGTAESDWLQYLGLFGIEIVSREKEVEMEVLVGFCRGFGGMVTWGLERWGM